MILLNGFFAASELALVSARKTRLRARADSGHLGARAALALLAEPTRLLSTVQIGITLCSILTGVYGGAVFAADLGTYLESVDWLAQYAHEIAYAIIVVTAGYFSLILGELVPKRMALAHADRFAEISAPVMALVGRVAAPLVWLLQISTDVFARLLPMTTAGQDSVSEDDLKALIAAGAKEGIFQRREQDMIEGVLCLADRPVESVMVPRGDIIWLDVNEPIAQLWQEARDSGHARFLLCRGELEELLGVVTLADLGDALRVGALDLEHHLRPPLHVPVGVSVLRLLELFRDSTTHLAIVTGEYGDIQGVATPIDILKAITGGLLEYGSRERAEAVRREDGSWLMDGHLPITEAQRILERNDFAHHDDYHTVAGLVLWHLGRVPAAGDSLAWRDLRFEVLDMDGQRIDKLLVSQRPLPVAPAGEEGDG
ncbi:MAG: hemolysin family protein [Steroidobacteraceae bacterium]